MIKQRSATDCGIATLANALSITYEKALELYNRKSPTDNPGVAIQETCAALYKAGYNPVYIPLSGFPKISGLSSATIISTSRLPKAPAILQVLTENGMIHQVYFDGKNIHDPSPSAPAIRSIEDYPDIIDCVFVSKSFSSVVRKISAYWRVWVIRVEIAIIGFTLRTTRATRRYLGYLADMMSGK